MKKSFLLCLLMTLFTTWAVQAAELTVHDGTTTNSSVPMYVFYFDDFTRSQTVFPAEELADMKNEAILSMKFYTSNTYAYTTAATVDIYLKEVEDATISEFVDKDDATIVYQGTLDFVLEDGKATVTIEFATPFEYNGGNLMFGCDNTTDPEYKSIYFYGETVSGASIAGYNSSSLDNVSPSQKSFIPKATFTYGTAPTCLKPTNLTVSNVTHNSATFDWNSDATKWQLNINGDDSGYISEKPYTTYMFNPSTSYTVKVRAVCGSDYSDWSNPITFSTSAVAEEVGNNWSDDFEGTSCGWSLVNGTLTNAWAWGTAANNGGTHALYISNDGGETNAYTKNSETMVFATKLLAFEDGEYEFSYDWLCNGEGTVGSSYWDYLRVALVPASVQLVAGTSVPSGFGGAALPSGWIALDGGSGLLKVTEWQSKTVSINNITAGNYYLVLAWRDDNSSGEDHPAAVDNVNIHKVTCSFDANAANLSVSNITTTSATLNWNNVSGVNSWNFAASLESTFPDDDEKTVTGTIPALITSFTIPNALIQGFTLKPGTTYYVKMRAACGTDDFGSWSNVLSFTTECEAITDATWSENFDDIAIASAYTPSVQTLPNCWKFINNTTYSTNGIYPTVYYYSYTDYSHSTPNMLRFYSSYSSYSDYDPQDQYAILPAMEDLSNKQITLWAKAGANGTSIQVGTIEDVNDASTFVKMETLELTTGYQEYIVSLAGSSEKHIAIMMEAADENNTIKSVYVDDITVEDLPECPKPMSLAVSNITAHNATFTWTSDADAWQLCINDGGDDEYYNVSANPFTISADLKPETEYTAKLRTLCEDDATSDWSNEVTFTTDIACYPSTFGAEAVSNLGATEATIAWDGNGEDYTLSYRKARYVEGLEETFGTSIPTGWTMYTGSYNEEEGTATLTASTYSWSFGNSNGVFDNHARVNIYGNNQRWLVTPQFVLEGSSLEFDLALTAFSGTLADPQTTGDDDKFLVLLSEDKENWKVLAQWDNVGTEFSYNDIAHTASGEHISIDLSDYEGSNIYIAFYGESTVSNADNNLHIDNVLCGTVHEPTAWISESGITEKSKQITGLEPETKYDVKVQSNCGSDGMSQESEIISFTTTPACVVPANLTASDITAHTATFSWNGESDYGWQLCINDGGDDEYYNVFANPFTISADLKPETEYTAKLRTLCEDDAHSEWSSTITFTTDVACPAPTNLEAELTPGNGKVASLRWAAGSAEDWILQYSESAAFEPAQEITVNGNSFYDLDDLTPETTYFARVKALCGDEDGDSEWSEPISFTPTNALSITLCNGTSNNEYVPFYGYYADEDQHNQMIYPAEGLAAMNGMSITQMVFYIDESANNGTNTAASRMGTWTVSLGETEATTLSGLDNTTSLTQVYEGYFDCSTGKLTIVFDAEYTYNGGNLLIDINHAAASYNRWYFYGVEATGASYSYGNQRNFLAKATFTYAEPAACAKPSGLTVEYNGGTEAVVSWTSDAESWNLEYGDALININQNPYTIQNLALATTYQVRVQALCSEENASDWTNVVEFTTDICLPEDMKTISYKLTDSYDDGWNGGAALRVVHKTTNKEVASLTLASGDSPLEGSLDLCCGEEYSFIWKKGSYDTECGFEIYDINGDIILSKEGCNSGCESPDDGAVLLDYTMNCEVITCFVPKNLAVNTFETTEATISWTGSADSYNVRYRTAEVRPAIFKEDFENGLDQWTVVSNGEDVVEGIKWQVLDPSVFNIGITAHSGSYVAMARSWSENVAYNASNWLISPQIDLQGILRFWIVDDGRYPENYEVLLSTTGNEIADFTIELKAMAETPSSDQWQEVEIDLSAYAGQQGYIAIHQEGYDADFMFIDDFGVYSANVTPAGEWINLPSTGAEITLSGLNPDTEYEIQVQSVCEDEESDWSNILSFRTAEPVGPICEAQVLPFYEDFEENSETRECWTTVAAAEDTEWAWDDQNNHFFRFYFGDEPQYLISPELIPEDMNARIAFDYKCENAQLSETFKLGYSYGGNSLDEFEWTDELLAEDAENWTQFACVVSGGVKYVAIQYTSIDQFALLIDNISVTATNKPTSVEALKNDAKAYKFVKDGALFILHNGKLFNAQGKFVK